MRIGRNIKTPFKRTKTAQISTNCTKGIEGLGSRAKVAKNASKYKNRKVERNGVQYDSKKEAARGAVLELKQRAGEVSELKRQVKFVLQESFKIHSKKTKQGFETIKEIAYIADFTYFMGGQFYIEDVKGYKTPEYKIKAKMLRKKIADGEIDAVFVES